MAGKTDMFDTHIVLSPYSSYKIGGPASYFCEAKSVDRLLKAISRAKKENLPVFILGGGTNLLISDEGFSGLVLKPDVRSLTADNLVITAGAGVRMEDLLTFAIDKGLSGLEWAGGLPGTLGGAIRGNAGAFGGEIKDIVHAVTSVAAGGARHTVMARQNAECRFHYRDSVFKERDGEEIILSAVLHMRKGDKKQIREAIEEKIRYRNERHPMEYPNIGSIFKNVPVAQINADITQMNSDTICVKPRRPAGRRDGNPRASAFAAPVKNDPFPVVPSAFFIAEAGLKGISSGGAMISPKHPNFIVNVLRAKSVDVKTLAELVKATVRRKFGITLEEEVMYIGY
jgi:UDP-N-acetylmuramate dehydrogenase